MQIIEFFSGEREVERTNWGDDHSDVRIACTTVARWVLIKSRAVECGNEKEISLKREIGIQTTQKQDFEAALKAGLEIKGFAKFATELKAKSGFEFKKEEHYIEEERFKIIAPQCGQKKLMIYQLVKEHRFEITDNRFFSFNKGKQYIPILEYTDNIWDRSPTAHNIPECNCEKLETKPEGILELALKNLNIVTAFWREGENIILENLDVTLSIDDLGRLMLGQYSVEANKLPAHLAFIGGFEKEEQISFSLHKIIRLNEQYDVRVEVASVNMPSYGFVRRSLIGEPQLLGGVPGVGFVKVGRSFEDDGIQVYPGEVYRGILDEE